MENNITVILNCYKRPQYLQEQLNSIKNQTVKPKEIWLWINTTEENKNFNPESLGFDKVFRSSTNCKYHARFAIGLLARTEYIAFFDDDTIPGDMWFENCLNTLKTHDGILGGAGCILASRLYYQHYRFGWPSQNEQTVEVDLVGHAWFLRRSHLNYMWYEIPATLENGEDIQLSFLAKKHGNIRTYCPPHPSNNLRLHSSLKAMEYGNDNKASSNGSIKPIQQFYSERDYCVSYSIDNGWKTVLGVK
jgi:glycosyltransferase involved in cell wall biosynthesis